MGRVIREGILEAHQYKNEYGDDWYVLNDDNKTPVKKTYFFNDDGSEKDKPFRSLYNTKDKTYSRDRYKVEMLNGEIFMIHSDSHDILNKDFENFKNFKTLINFIKDQCIDDTIESKYYTNIFRDHMFCTIKCTTIKDNISSFIKSLNNVDLHVMNPLKDEKFFMLERTYVDDVIFTLYCKKDDFNLSELEILNLCKSSSNLEKFKL